MKRPVPSENFPPISLILVPLEGIWDPFAQSNFWFANLNWTPLVFLKPSSQVNNFTVFFSLFHGNVKKCVFNMLGLGWLP